MYKKPSFAHELTECSQKMTKKNVRIRFQDTIVNKRTIRTELL